MRCPEGHFDHRGRAQFRRERDGKRPSPLAAAKAAAVSEGPSYQSSEKVDDDESIAKYAGDAVMAIFGATSYGGDPIEP